MSYQTRAYDDEHGQPVVVMAVEGTHDVSRLVQMLMHGTCEQYDVGERVLRQVRRHNGGRAALRLLRDHGGADFTEDEHGEDPHDPHRCKGMVALERECDGLRRELDAWAGV